MARLARVVAVGVPHHVTQRGNARQFILASEAERMVYLDLLRQSVQLHGLSVMGYCLMSNHVHLVVVPQKTDSLAAALKQTHGRYASYWNALHASSGHVWQGRFYSCPLDQPHLWEALRYAELNPVRAGLTAEAESWKWSSAGAHCGTEEPDVCLEMETWRRSWAFSSRRSFLGAEETESDLAALRQCTHTGRPLGTSEFTEALEKITVRRLAAQKGGRPGKPAADKKQQMLGFDPQYLIPLDERKTFRLSPVFQIATALSTRLGLQAGCRDCRHFGHREPLLGYPNKLLTTGDQISAEGGYVKGEENDNLEKVATIHGVVSFVCLYAITGIGSPTA